MGDHVRTPERIAGRSTNSRASDGDGAGPTYVPGKAGAARPRRRLDFVSPQDFKQREGPTDISM